MIALHNDFAARAIGPAELLELGEALRTEGQLIEKLRGLVRGQRDAVGRDDPAAVEESVYSMHRVLFTLREARRRRRTLHRLLGWSEGLRLTELDEALGMHARPEIIAARDSLCAATRELAREVELNRAVLRRALSADGEYATALAGAHTEAGYGAVPAAGPARAIMFDRRG